MGTAPEDCCSPCPLDFFFSSSFSLSESEDEEPESELLSSLPLDSSFFVSVSGAGFSTIFSMTGEDTFGPGGGEGTLVTAGFSDLSVSVSDESLLPELELLEIAAGFVLASAGFSTCFSMTGDEGFGPGGGEGTFVTGGFSDLSVSVPDESLLPELELLDAGFVVASAGFCTLFSMTGDEGFGPGGGDGTFVTGGFSDLSVSVSDESLLLELELETDFVGLACSSDFVITVSSFL